jgi:hypothetical protein
MPRHHDVRASDVFLRRFHASLEAARNSGAADFQSLLMTPGVGARTVLSLAMVAEVIHGTPCRFADPARFSLAHGGKDGHPYPVPLDVYDRTIRVMKDAVSQARLGNEERLDALKRLDAESRRVEQRAKGPLLEDWIDHERTHSWRMRGMTAAGPALPPGVVDKKRRTGPPGQLTLPGLENDRGDDVKNVHERA